MRIIGRTRVLTLLLVSLGLLLITIYIFAAIYPKDTSSVPKANSAKVKRSSQKVFNEVIELKSKEPIKVKYRTISKNNARKVVQVEKNSPVISSAKAIKAAKRLLPDYATIREANLVIITNPKPSGLLWQVAFDSFTGPPESDPFHYASGIYLDPLTGKEHKF